MQNNYPMSLSALDTQQLPVLPPGAPALLKKLSDEDMDFLQLAGVIEAFPTIVARLIALANSAWSSPLSTITNIEEVCSRLGFNVVRSTSIALVISAPFNLTYCPAFDVPRFWTRAMLVADTVTALEQRGNHSYKESARSAGLLHNLGLLLIVSQLPEQTDQIFSQHSKDDSVSLGQMLTETFGFDYCIAGGLLAERWELPSSMARAMTNHRDLEQHGVDSILSHAVAIVEAVENNIPYEPIESSSEFTDEDASKVFTQISKQLEKTTELAKILFGS